MERSRSKIDIWRNIASKFDDHGRQLSSLRAADRSVPQWVYFGTDDVPFYSDWGNYDVDPLDGYTAVPNPAYGEGLYPAGFWRDASGIVHLKGVISHTEDTDWGDVPALYLPEGFRPGRYLIPGIQSSPYGIETYYYYAYPGFIVIDVDGSILVPNYNYPEFTPLDGIFFRAES